MAKGDYLDRQRKAQQTYLDIGEEMGMQKMWDYVQIALRDPDVMGKDILGKARLQKVYKNWANWLTTIKPHLQIIKKLTIAKRNLTAFFGRFGVTSYHRSLNGIPT